MFVTLLVGLPSDEMFFHLLTFASFLDISSPSTAILTAMLSKRLSKNSPATSATQNATLPSSAFCHTVKKRASTHRMASLSISPLFSTPWTANAARCSSTSQNCSSSKRVEEFGSNAVLTSWTKALVPPHRPTRRREPTLPSKRKPKISLLPPHPPLLPRLTIFTASTLVAM